MTTRIKAFLNRTTAYLEDHEITNGTRAAAAVIPVAAILLPWLTLDGSSSSLTGSELIAYALTSPERTPMLQTTFIGGLALFLLPTLTITLSVLAFVKTFLNQHPLALNASAAVLAVILLATTGPITSTAVPTAGGIKIPDWGIMLTIVPHLGLAAHTVWLRYYSAEENP